MNRNVVISVVGAIALAGSTQAKELDRVVFLEAHPDDLASEMGTAVLMKGIYEMHVIDYTHGEWGCGEEKATNGWTKATRTAEEGEVCRRAGFRLHWCDAIDGFAYADSNVCAQLTAYLADIRPRAVFCHWPIDTHPDHMMSAAAAIKATQLAGIRPEIYFQEQEIQSRAFQPVYWVDVSALTERRRELISMWASQNGPKIAERKIRTSETNALRLAPWKWTHAEIFGVFPSTVPPGRGIFDELPGVMR